MPWNNPTVWNGSSSCIYYIKLFMRRDRQIIKVAINLTNWSFQSWIFCMCSSHLLAPPCRAWSGFGVASTTRNDCVTPRNRSCAEMLKIFKQMKCNKMGGNQKNKSVIMLTIPKSCFCLPPNISRPSDYTKQPFYGDSPLAARPDCLNSVLTATYKAVNTCVLTPSPNTVHTKTHCFNTSIACINTCH